MDKFERVTAVAAPFQRDNVDTDVIIRIERLLGATRASSLGPYCLEALRYLPDGSDNPDFILNKPAYRHAAILMAGANFGCGSSREGAVWALQHAGIRCVIASSFGEIFFGNCFQNGLLPVMLSETDILSLVAEVEADPQTNRISVDLTDCVVIAPSGRSFPFAIAPMRRDGMLRGLDEIDMTLTRDDEVSAFQARDRRARPWIYDTVAFS